MTSLSASVTVKSGSHGHLPYVPPFLDPHTRPYIELSFTPNKDKVYTIPEIIDNVTASYYNIAEPSNAETNTNYKEAMSLSASIDFKKYVKLISDNYTVSESGHRTPLDPSSTEKFRWVIQPKWETPIMDFQDREVQTLNLNNGTVVSTSKSPWKTRYQTTYYEEFNESGTPYLTSSTGMWHQSGSVITKTEQKGYYLTIESADYDPQNNVADLASIVGFVPEPHLSGRRRKSGNSYSFKKLGQLAERKKISEAVVAIPYYITYQNRKNVVKLFSLNQTAFHQAQDLNIAKKEFLTKNLQDSPSIDDARLIKESYEEWHEKCGQDAVENIAYQLRMMEKYILPPQFDFLQNPEDVDPHVAYIFQFKSELTREDLASIWQNMYPVSTSLASKPQHSTVSSDSSESDTEYVTSFLEPGDIGIFKDKESNYKDAKQFLNEEVRWLVFKAKLRASSHYYEIVENSVSDTLGDIENLEGTEYQGDERYLARDERTEFGEYGYNWPYDYFSLVELIKVESKVDFYSKSVAKKDGNSFRTQEARFEMQEGPQETEVLEISEAGAGSSYSLEPESQSSDSSATIEMVVRETLKADDDPIPTPADTLTVATATIKSGTESLYVNGMLQGLYHTRKHNNFDVRLRSFRRSLYNLHKGVKISVVF